ncbi:MAG: thiamine phosphate synthase [Planctomycetes bacterium]|nr:thiamine phosphate synthase [Planctomycetota bacterium]
MEEALRVIDANLNRAREGLRTAEDYARYILKDQVSQRSLKQLRRSLREVVNALGEASNRLLHARDVEADVGVDDRADAPREDMRSIAKAGLKRTEEALRVIEEFAQLVNPKASASAAAMRYAVYIAEQQLLAGGPLRAKLAEQPVLVIFTREMCLLPWREMLGVLLTAGASAFQLREKRLTLREFCRYAAEFVEVARGRGAITTVNDRVDVAFAARADGVHLGRDDFPIAEARRMLGHGAIIGASAHNLKDAQAAIEEGADYIGVGAMYETSTKDDVEKVVGPALLEQVLPEVSVPAFAIGGIKAGNLAPLIAAGARHVAVCSAIIRSNDPAQAYHEIAALVNAARMDETRPEPAK